MFSYLKSLLFFFCILMQDSSYAQIQPAEGAKLNYRIVGFSFAKNNSDHECRVEVAHGFYKNVDSFMHNVVAVFPGKTRRIIGELPSFGQQYTWRVVYGAGTNQPESILHHFSTIAIPETDTNMLRLRVLKNKGLYKDCYVFLDANRTLYDMNGAPVWYIPIEDGIVNDNMPSYGDIKATAQGTITFITNRKSGHIYDIDYNGNVIWRGPADGKISGDSIEHFNHEFTRLANGNYLVLGSEYKMMKLPGKIDSAVFKVPGAKDIIFWDAKRKSYYERVQFGTLIEYDSYGKIIWSWRSSGYFTRSDVYDHVNSSGVFDFYDVHENAFYFDERSKSIYVSFREMSRILKVSYPGGKVIQAYGKRYTRMSPDYDNPLFHHQHNCALTHDGYLSVYNNNNGFEGSLPTLVLMKEPLSAIDTLARVWEYQCTLEGMDTSVKEIPEFAGLGNMSELPDHSFLACMTSDDFTKVFIVDRNKVLLWSALPEKFDPIDNKWHTRPQYRASLITKQMLTKMIWSAEPGGNKNKKVNCAS